MAIGETILGAIIQVVLQQLASDEVLNFFRHYKIDESLVDKLKQLMPVAGKLSNDAEEKSFNNRDIKRWHDELKHWFYRAEEVVDVIAANALRFSIESPPNATPSCGIKVPNLISCFHDFRFTKTINKEMREIVDMLEGMLRQGNALGLREIINQPQRLPTTSLLVDEVYGRKEEKDEILEFLKLEEEPQGSKIGVVAILGMGGIGKTTLSKLVYEDYALQGVFDPKVWVFVGEDPGQFDVTKVTRSILTEVTRQEYPVSLDLNFLQNELTAKLRDKKFLLVLDDAWSESYLEWETLRAPLLSGEKGSKIIVTTRSDKVADVIGATKRLPLSLLSPDDCLELLFRHAIVDANSNEDGNLKDTGRKIVAKCQRLPLAIKTIAGHLRGTQGISEWERVLNSNLWELSNGRSDVIPALWISYSHLPPYLKRCFSYCATFPKGIEHWPFSLARLWMAENFVISDGNENNLEDVGNGYVQQLLSRSFLEAVDGGKVKMHDLMHDLAQLASGDFIARDNLVSQSESVERVRHFSYVLTHYGNLNNFPITTKMKHLRTFAQWHVTSKIGPQYFLSERVISTLTSHSNHLRVLELCGYELLTLPESIGRLKQLRYLNVSCTKIKYLPESVSTLYYLQTLVLTDCKYLERLPADLWKLKCLHRLSLEGTTSLLEMPRHMGNLKCLRYLSDFVVGNNTGSSIKELRELRHTGESLVLSRLQNVTVPDDAHDVNLSERESITRLALKFDCKDTTTESEKDRQVQLLENLKPSTNLQSLWITNYAGRRFPKWLDPDCARYVKMTILVLCGCSYAHTLPPLGLLPSLKELLIEGMDHVETVGDEFYGHNNCDPFPSLESLSFDNMKGWKRWSNVDAQGNTVRFPHLQKLRLRNCPNLVGNFPTQGPLLCRDVEIVGCEQFGGLVSHVSHEHMVEGPSSPSAEFGNVFDLKLICKLRLAGLTQLVKLPSELVMLSSLRELTIVSCSNLKSLANVQLSREVKSLEITQCELLESLPNGLEFLHLYQISLKQCPCLSWATGDNLPTTLSTLTIKDCERLEFPIQIQRMQEYTSLKILLLENTARNLVSFPLCIFPNLAKLRLWFCMNLEKVYIPEEIGGDNLTSLGEFSMLECPKLEMVGKPTERGETTILRASNLFILGIVNCRNLKTVEIVSEEGLLLPKLLTLYVGKIASEWTLGRGLSRLSSLTTLSLSEQNVERFPNIEAFGSLPTCLLRLMIAGFPKLRELDGRALQTLTSLQNLYIAECPELERLPEEGLTPSLSVLQIRHCPKLEERCRKKKGREWDIIKHLHAVIINENVFLPNTHGMSEEFVFLWDGNG